MDTEEINELAARLDGILEAVESRAEPEVAAAVAELLEGLQRVHAEGLRRLADLLRDEPSLLERALEEPVVSNLFYLYDLSVVDQEERVRRALDAAGVMARSHGGEIEVLAVEDGRVRLRVEWSHDSVSREAGTLREGIEFALRQRLPGFRGVEIEGLEGEAEGPPEAEAAGADGPAPGFAPVDGGADVMYGPPGEGEDAGGRSLPVVGERSRVPEEKMERLRDRMRDADGPEGAGALPRERVEVVPLDDLAAGELQGFMVREHQVPVLLVRVAGAGVRAYRNVCPGSMLPLHYGTLEEGEIHCPWHGCRFEAATGRPVSEEAEAPLERFPTETEGGAVWVEVPAEGRG